MEIKRREPMEIRFVTEQNAKQLQELFVQLGDEKGRLTQLKETIRRLEKNEDYGLFGAFEGEKLIGFVMGVCCQDVYGDCRKFLVIENVIVDENYHGKEVAKQLFETMEQWSKEQDCYYAILVSGMIRERAHHFYEKMGYTKEAGFRKYY